MESPISPAPTLNPSLPSAASSSRGRFAGSTAILLIIGLAVMMLRVAAARAGTNQEWVTLALQIFAAGSGAVACLWALRQAGTRWTPRVRIAWACIGVSAVMFTLGWATYGFTSHPKNSTVSSADGWWIVQQPLLWIGLFLLAWRGRSLGMMRLLADNLIVALAAIVLSWTLILEQRLFSEQYAPLARAIAIYYPVFDIAHLFCVLMLLANVRERPALARAAGWLVLGVSCLIVTDLVTSYFFFNRRLSNSPWLEIGQMWSYLLIGVAALTHARASIGASSGDEAPIGESSVEAGAALQAAHWDEKLARWHRSAMLWLPYVATLGVSGVLISQELKKSNSETVQRLLPVLSLLLAIVARQMITLWDNLQLAEKLRSSNTTLERSVDERTRHLATLHGITSTLNTSLDKRTVLRVTLEKTIAAVGADGGGIWLRDARRDVYTEGAPGDEWTLVHWQGLDGDAAIPSILRDLAIAEAEAENGNTYQLAPAAREAMESGLVPPRHQLITVPVRWQGALLGVMGMVRVRGSFTYEDRALGESVALEAGTALQNARLYSEAAHRADRDSVTELFNHRAIQEQLTSTLARCKRTGDKFSIVMMDLNNFKFFNDTYGHPVGDDVLRAVARSLKESTRGSDVLGRYGGDEFIVLLPDTDVPGTIEVCQRIKAVLDSRHIEPVPGTKIPIATAFGWAAFPQDGDSIHELLTQADANLYNHKRGGASYLSQSAKAARESREELKRLKSRAFGGSFGVLDALVTAIDNKDHYTRHHSEEVTYLSLLVARELGYSAEMLQAVRISGLLHDVGKIAVPDDILRHPGKLGREEWEIMQQHPVFGALIVKDVPNLEIVLEGIRYHHERWDGTGYPDKLAGEKIPEMGRLLTLADCYSALTTDRPYRKGWKPEAALEEIERCKGTQYDPRLCDAFLTVMRRELLAQAENEEKEEYATRIAQTFGEAIAPESAVVNAPESVPV
ncbi:MAG: diguanylate cyclase [Armatimonadetes bacterium]|nr:diguanylate cyclase [Armatimonadota bacterium]